MMSCNDSEDDTNVVIDEDIERLSSELFDTNWKHQKTIICISGKTETLSSTGLTLNLSSSITTNGNQNPQRYVVGINGHLDPYTPSWWYISEEGLCITISCRLSELGYSASEVGRIGRAMPFMNHGIIQKHTKSELILEETNEYGYVRVYYKGDDGYGDDIPNDNPNSTEEPEVGFYDFTATKTSLKVQYKIYNKDEAGVKSAKIYYGTTSNPTASKTASVSGTLITANITGLKAGTTYYVKCSVTGKAGTTTTEVTKCITNY